jgi:signal transduction histidine kinase
VYGAIVSRADSPFASDLTSASAGILNGLFAEYPLYLCIPCGRTALALATHHELQPAIIAALEVMATRLGPVVGQWLIEAEVERLQRLVRSLGLRMFSAVDRERQRIARDLHDHQTQLLTAARIALEADPAKTRHILRELDASLRQ